MKNEDRNQQEIFASTMRSESDALVDFAVREIWMEGANKRREAYLRGEVQVVSYHDVMRAAKVQASL